jgi:CBS domain-containing protein/sporulation protein YlmC with PRC-barrel domain
MLYFSKILGKKVFTEDGAFVGKLDDFIILISSLKPKVNKIMIKKNNDQKIIIPIDCLLSLNDEIIIKKNYSIAELQANELFILRNIFDKQIIDLAGNKIVRVNDICLQKKGDDLYLVGVDVGFLGILRRIGLEELFLNISYFLKIKIKPKFLSWADIQPLELTRGLVTIRKKEEKLNRLLPEDLADYLEKTNIENVSKIIELLDDKKAAEVINDLNLNYQIALFKKFNIEQSVRIIKYLDADEAVDILLTLPIKKQEEILSQLPKEKKAALTHLIKHSKTSIGELMTTEFIKVKPELTLKEVIEKIKKEAKDFYFLTTIYVVNDQDELIGVANIHELLINNWNLPIYQIMHQNLVVVRLTTPREVVIKKMLKYNLQVLPVIDDKKHLLGIVTIDDLSEYILGKFKK